MRIDVFVDLFYFSRNKVEAPSADTLSTTVLCLLPNPDKLVSNLSGLAIQL